MSIQGRITSQNWDNYDTRHVVFRPARMPAQVLEAGYRRAYREFYRWGSIFRSAWAQDGALEKLRHLAYAGGWKKFEPLWDLVIRARRVGNFLPVLESILERFGNLRTAPEPAALPVAGASQPRIDLKLE
jgi:hypothetical protein